MSTASVWWWRIRQAVATYLPLLLMALLALATLWLVKNTPEPEEAAKDAPVRSEPDYTMQDFALRRFAKDGRRDVQIDGDAMRHYPDTDRFEIDQVRIVALGADGARTRASARRAISNSDATEVQLVGGAEVVQEGKANEPPIEMRGEFLHAFLDTERVRSHLPVWVRQGATQVHADAFEYDHLTRVVQFKGKVRATIAPRGER